MSSSPGLHSVQTRSSSTRSKPFVGYINTTLDAIKIVVAAKNGLIPRVTRRFDEEERDRLIKSGAVFVYSPQESGIHRWTDGIGWGHTRVQGNFLISHELICPPSNRAKSQPPALLSTPASRRSPYYRPTAVKGDGLVKKMNEVYYHVVTYYLLEDLQKGHLQEISSRHDIASIDIDVRSISHATQNDPPMLGKRPREGGHLVYNAKPPSHRSKPHLDTDITRNDMPHSIQMTAFPTQLHADFSSTTVADIQQRNTTVPPLTPNESIPVWIPSGAEHNLAQPHSTSAVATDVDYVPTVGFPPQSSLVVQGVHNVNNTGYDGLLSSHQPFHGDHSRPPSSFTTGSNISLPPITELFAYLRHPQPTDIPHPKESSGYRKS